MANEEDLVPELGDFVTFVSDLYKTTVGIIIYRDGSLIRIRPVNSTQPVVDFPLDPNTGEFQTSLGVTDILIHTKRTDPHFSKQLSVVPGERLELLDADGRDIEPPVTVFELIATDDYDAIKLEDGRILDFQFMGPPAPYVLLRARAAPEDEAPAGIEEDVDAEPEEVFPDIDMTLLAAALVEEIPSEERTYSDSIQREDMFVSLLVDHSPERQKDPKIMSKLYRVTDVLLAMKNSLLQRDETGAPVLGAEQVNYTATTLQEALEKQSNGAPLAALLPVAAVKKVLYTDDEPSTRTDVVIRNDTVSLINALSVANMFSVSKEEGNPFVTYINGLLKATAAFVPVQEGGKRISVDQDVFRSQMPPNPIEGFPKTGAAFTNDRPPELIMLMANALGNINKSNARLIGPSYLRNPKTNSSFVVAPADSGEVVGHLLLSKDLMDWRVPIRTNILLWDVLWSERSRSKQKTYYNSFDDTKWQTVLPGDITSLKDELMNRASPSLQFTSRALSALTDSLGLRNLEFTEDTFSPLVNAVERGTSDWDKGFAALKEAALRRMSVESEPVFLPVSSSVWTDLVLKNATVEPFIAIINEKESTLANNDLMLANDIGSLAGGTLGPFTSGILGNVVTTDTEAAFKNETARELRNKTTLRENAKRLQAEPDINPCEHVKELEKTRSIRDDSKRMIIFDKFVKKYSGGQQGNFILCGNCGKDLVCKHEIILLNEFLNPGRAAALHKTLLLEYAGPVFEGAYICKTCGQKIMELEYDTHLEFDDEGHPLVGRGVVEKDEEEDFDVAIAANADNDIPFVGVKRKLYFQLRALFELCGMALDLAVYKRAVETLNAYIDTYVSTEEAYLAVQERAKAAATKASKKFTPVPYINFQSTQIIGAVGALAVLELQTNPIHVPIAAPGCVLARGGFPLDGVDPATAGTGALDYVSCALATIKRDDVPWNKVFWSTETDMKRRVEQSKNTILLAIAKLLGIQLKGMPPLVPLENNAYKQLLDDKRANKVSGESADAGLASNGDKIPPSFRPLQRMTIPEIAPISNVELFKKDVVSGDIVPIRQFTYEHQLVLNMKLVANFHSAASESGVIQDNNPCSESVCCTRKLSELNQIGNGVGSLSLPEGVFGEVDLLKKAVVKVSRRDPAMSHTGTHFYVPWSAPQQFNVLPTPDESVYYKLFLKNCYKGRKYGTTHELDESYKCRNCGFQYPAELAYMNPAEITETGKKQELAIEAQMKQREQIALAAFSAQGVDINEEKFRELEEAIRNKKLVVAAEPVHIVKFFESLENIKRIVSGCDSSVVEDWESFVGGMKLIQAEQLTGIKRLGKLVDFSRRYEALLTRFRTGLVEHASEKASVPPALDILVSITGFADSHTVIRTLQTQFVVTAQQIATEYSLAKPPIRKWFPKVNKNHVVTLNKIWEVFGDVTKQTQGAVDDLSSQARDVAKKALETFVGVLGPVLRVWSEDLRPNLGFTPEEYTQVVRWTFFSMLNQLVNPNSAFFKGSPSVRVTVDAVKALSNWIVLAAATSGNIGRKYMLTDDEIKSRVNARKEQEKAMFIDKMDKQEQEMRKLELTKKKLKIGDWAAGSQNLFKYNVRGFEFERAQRAAMGLPEFTEDVTGPMPVADEGANFHEVVQEVHGMEEGVLHRAAQDEDQDDAGEDAGRLHFVC